MEIEKIINNSIVCQVNGQIVQNCVSGMDTCRMK